MHVGLVCAVHAISHSAEDATVNRGRLVPFPPIDVRQHPVGRISLYTTSGTLTVGEAVGAGVGALAVGDAVGELVVGEAVGTDVVGECVGTRVGDDVVGEVVG